MLEYLAFQGFKGFQAISLEDLRQITLISGRNNVGKSSVLEGIFLLIDHLAPDSFAKISAFRGNSRFVNATSLWEPLFFGMDTSHPLCINVVYDGIKENLCYCRDDNYTPSDPNAQSDLINQFITAARTAYTLRFSFEKNGYKEDGHFALSQAGVMRSIKTSNLNDLIENMPHAQYINSMLASTDMSVVDWFGKMELADKKEQVIDALKIIEPSLTTVLTLSANGVTQLYGKVNKQMMPLKIMGDGINRLLYILLAMIGNPNSIILLDEIETGFHYSFLEKLWEVISKTAKDCNCQVIATTHSYECITGALSGVEAADAKDSFCYYRLDKQESKTYAHRFSFDLLSDAVMSDLEVR